MRDVEPITVMREEKQNAIKIEVESHPPLEVPLSHHWLPLPLYVNHCDNFFTRIMRWSRWWEKKRNKIQVKKINESKVKKVS